MASFLLFELLCGMYFPSIGSLRSTAIPSHVRSTIMNIFRIPLNIIVATILLKTNSLTNQHRLLLCMGLQLLGAVAVSTIKLSKKKVE